MAIALRYEKVPPWELEISKIEVGGFNITDGTATLVLTLQDESVMVIECKPGVRLFPNKKQRLHRNYLGAVRRSEIIENAKVAELADAPA